MTSMELNALRGELAREILNVEDIELLKKVKRSISQIIAKAKKEEANDEYRPATKAEILENLDRACKEVKLYREGKLELKSLEEALDEL